MGVVPCVGNIFFSDTAAALRAAEILIKSFPHDAVQREGPVGRGAPGALAAVVAQRHTRHSGMFQNRSGGAASRGAGLGVGSSVCLGPFSWVSGWVWCV